MTTDIMTMDTHVDHFLISTYENQLLFIVLDDQQAEKIWEN